MKKVFLLTAAVLLQTTSLWAEVLRGKVVDASSGEDIIGATVIIKGTPDNWAITGLDGSFALETDLSSGTLICNLIGYKDAEMQFNSTIGEMTILMEQDVVMLDAAVITATGSGRTEVAARSIERNSVNVVNVMSAKAMELSPDITVANVIKRMSGVTVERNSSGEGQYAILRGMDKRYNYTLVNGIKIPSPDNKNRFVPLDIFPSEILDRIEVTKSLTADMEGDGIGGARAYSDEQNRMGAHVKLDYRFSGRHKLMLYAGYMDLRESEVRDGYNDQERTVRMKWNHQYIFNTTLKGEHSFLRADRLKLDWTGVFSKAYSTTPDNARIYINGDHLYNTDSADRRWEHNSDRDIAGYVNISYRFDFAANSTLDLKAGGMYRDKVRNSFFNEYTFDSPTGIYDLQIYGQDWTNFDELLLEPRRFGNVGDPLNYDAFERIGAAYLMGVYNWDRLEVIAGLRVEHTDQGYTLVFPRQTDGEGHQVYTDLLPSVHLKYGIHRNAFLRFSYGRSINRPGFFEIVPYTILNEDYDEQGNPDLKHTVADNLDLRYEFFPKSSEQFMIGLFWKKLHDPIEYGLISEGQATYLTPMNFGDAVNAGVEVDIMKYFNWFGIKANYTYTHSSITTTKRAMDGTEVIAVTQTRPLYGQAAHVANLSLLFKFAKAGVEAQVSGSYTGRRLSEISNWVDNDIWEAGYVQLDASVEKSFKCGITIFAKANNLLDMPVLRYIVNNPRTENLNGYERYRGGVIERREWHGQSAMIGLRYSFKER